MKNFTREVKVLDFPQQRNAIYWVQNSVDLKSSITNMSKILEGFGNSSAEQSKYRPI